MTEAHQNFDPEALLEHVDAGIILALKDGLANDDWKKLAGFCVSMEGKRVFSQVDMNRFSKQKFPAKAFVNELVKRNINMKYLCSLLKAGEMYELLEQIGNIEPVHLKRQSISGLLYIALGERVHVEIEATGIPPPTYQWYKGDNPLVHRIKNAFSIDNFTTEDEGIYLCRVKQVYNGKEVDVWSSPIQCCVKEVAPTFTCYPKDAKLVDGDKLELFCEVSGYPHPTYSWYKDDQLIAKGDKDPRLLIENVCLSDSGSYKCSAKNNLGEASSMPAIVKVRPGGSICREPLITQEPLLWESDPERSIGQSFALVCRARCVTNLTFTWVVNGRPLQESSSNRHIIMTSSSEPDFTSSLLYTIDNTDGSKVKVICIVKSADSSVYSREVRIKVVHTDGPLEYNAGTKWALLVANTNYSIGNLPPLFTPTSDMEKIAKELNDLDFHCFMLTNLSLSEFKNAVKLFSVLVKPGDYVVFCYAGHGLYSGVDQLLPVPDHNSTKELETLSSVWVRTMIQKNDPALLFIVLDMCRHIHVSPRDQGPFELVKSPVKRNCLILNATAEGYQSLEGPKRSSVLSRFLVKHLKDKVDVVTMARSVLRDVEHMSNFVRNEQIPKLDMTLCDSRSLTDPQTSIDEKQEKLWSSLAELPAGRSAKVDVNGTEVEIVVSCAQGGNFSVVFTVMLIHVEFQYRELPPGVSLEIKVNAQNKIRRLSNKKFVYEIDAVHKLKDPIILVVGFQLKSTGRLIEERFNLGLPGIANVNLADDAFNPCLRVKNAGSNIP